MSKGPNYIKLVNDCWQTMPNIEGYKASHVALYFAIIDSINCNGWRPVKMPLEVILTKAGMSKDLYLSSRKWLVDNNFLGMVPGENGHQMVRFYLKVEGGKSTATPSADPTTNTDSTEVLPDENPPADPAHYINNKHSITTKQETINKQFENFWSAYDKKINRSECLKIFSRLDIKTRQKILEHVPKYVKATPDKTYRLNPINFLKRKTYEDELPTERFNGTRINNECTDFKGARL